MTPLNLPGKGLPQMPQICAEVFFASQKNGKKQGLCASQSGLHRHALDLITGLNCQLAWL